MSNPAETYESYIVPSLFAPWAETLVRLAEPRPGERVLDVACGTGIVARRLRSAVGQACEVHGVDPNPGMLAVARAASEREGHAIEWAEGRAEDLPFPADDFDLVMCQQGAQFFGDRELGFAEMRRVLKEDGRAVVSTWQSLERHDFFNSLHEAMERELGTTAASVPFTLGDGDELGDLMADAGFGQVAVEEVSQTAVYPDPDRFLSETIDALMAVVVSMLDIDREQLNEGVEAIKSDLREPLARHTNGNHVHLPWHGNIAIAVA